MKTSTLIPVVAYLALSGTTLAAPVNVEAEHALEKRTFCFFGFGWCAAPSTTTATPPKSTASSVAPSSSAKVTVTSSSAVKSSATSAVASSSAKVVSSAAASSSVKVAVPTSSAASKTTTASWAQCTDFDWNSWGSDWTWGGGFDKEYVKAWYVAEYGYAPPQGMNWRQVSSLVSKFGQKTKPATPKTTSKYTGKGCSNPWTSATNPKTKTAVTTAPASTAVVSKPAVTSAASSAAVSKPASSAAVSSAAASSAKPVASSSSSAAVVVPSSAVVQPVPSASSSAAAGPASSAVVQPAPSALSSAAAQSSVAAASSVDAQPSAAASSSAVAQPSSSAEAQPSSSAVSSDATASSSDAPAASSSASSAASPSATSGSDGSAGTPGTGSGNPGTGAGSNNSTGTTTSDAPVATTPAAVMVNGFTYGGCAQEIAGRLLDNVQTSSSSQTIEACTALCRSYGMPVAGLEYGSECYCSDNLAEVQAAAVSGECKMACSGDDSEICGGPNAINWYFDADLTPATVQLPAGWTTYGVVSEGQNGRLLSTQLYSSSDNTVEKCANACKDAGFTIAGTEYSSECFCGNSFSAAANGGELLDDSAAFMKCSGNIAQVCGGPSVLSITSAYGNNIPSA